MNSVSYISKDDGEYVGDDGVIALTNPHCISSIEQWGVFKINESLIGGTAYVVNYPISNNKTWIVLSAFHSGFEYIKIISKVYSRWESSCEITTNETIESNKNTSIFLFIIGNN